MSAAATVAPPGEDRRPGRFCPADYRLSPASFDAGPAVEADVLYVVGGLYGNTEALRALEELVASERAPRVEVVLNGDFHWFDADPAEFAAIEAGTRRFVRLRGNVETELGRAPAAGEDAGCGCAYPDSVSDAEVERSNAMLGRLRATARAAGCALALAALAALPAVARARVGELRVAITHGDDGSLAGWGFAHDRVEQAWDEGLAQRMRALGVQCFASSHTCLPVASSRAEAGEAFAVVNNGAAGMGNFAGSPDGLVTRIARAGFGAGAAPAPLYAATLRGAEVAAMPLRFDQRAWQARFRAQWPQGSAADLSYWQRIVEGPAFALGQAARGIFAAGARA